MIFSSIEMAPSDPLLGLNEEFIADCDPNKINLSIGVYHDDNGKLPLMRAISIAEKSKSESLSPRGYLPIEGTAVYRNLVRRLLFNDIKSLNNDFDINKIV